MNDLIQNSTIHGLNHIYSARNKVSKFLWLIFFLIGLCGIIINVILIILRYMSNPILVSHTIDYEPFKWPDLTFCNPSAPFNIEEDSPQFQYWRNISNHTDKLANMLYEKSLLYPIKDETRGDQTIEKRTIIMSSLDLDKIKFENPRNLFSNILFSKRKPGIYFAKHYEDPIQYYFPLVMPLSIYSTQMVQIINNIPCHTIQVEDTDISMRKDIDSLTLYITYIFKNFQLFNPKFIYACLFLYITNNKELPQDKEIILQPGYTYSVNLNQIHYQRNGVKRNCRNEKYTVDLYDALLQTTKLYEGNYEDCKRITIQSIFVNECRCYSPFLPIFKNRTGFPRICLNATYFSEKDILTNAECMTEVYTKYQNEYLFNNLLNKNCKIFDNVKCDEIVYKKEERRGKSIILDIRCFESEMKTSNINCQNISENDLIKRNYESNTIILTVRRDSISGDMFKEEREYPFYELLSDIGGLMGLWLGMSVIGLLEVMEFIYTIIYVIYWNNRRNLHEQHNLEINNNNLLTNN